MTQQTFPAHWRVYFAQFLKINLQSETTVSQAQPAFISVNLAILTVK